HFSNVRRKCHMSSQPFPPLWIVRKKIQSVRVQNHRLSVFPCPAKKPLRLLTGIAVCSQSGTQDQHIAPLIRLLSCLFTAVSGDDRLRQKGLQRDPVLFCSEDPHHPCSGGKSRSAAQISRTAHTRVSCHGKD